MKKNLKKIMASVILLAVTIAPSVNAMGVLGQDNKSNGSARNASSTSNTSNTLGKTSKIDLEDKEIFKHIKEVTKDSITVVDARDKEVTIKKNPKKVVCVYNSFLDLWYKSGGTVIGKADDAKDKPVDGAKDAQNVGAVASPSLEKITSLEPDFVILGASFKAHREIAKQLEEQGVTTLIMDPNNFNDYLELVRIYTFLNNRDDLFKTLAEDIKGEIDAIKEMAPNDKNIKVAYIFATSKNLTLRTSMTATGEILKDLNVENIADKIAEGKESIDFSLEKLIEEDPDFIFVSIMGSDEEKVKETIKKDAESNEAWASLKAVKNGNYIVLPKDLYMYKPNDRYAEAYLGLAKILYKDVFK